MTDFDMLRNETPEERQEREARLLAFIAEKRARLGTMSAYAQYRRDVLARNSEGLRPAFFDDWVDDLAENEHRIGLRDRFDLMPVGWRVFLTAVIAVWALIVWAAWLAIGWLL